MGVRGGCEGLTDSTRARHARGTRERLRTLRGRLANALTTIAGQQLDSARMCARMYARMYAQLRGNSTGHAPKVSPSQRSESVKLRGNSRVFTSRRCAESRLRCRLRPCRIRQAKGELHRARVQVSCRIRQAKGELHRARVQVSPPPVSNPSS